jgi:riboflavin kinase / FMN adenylyltransferase
MQHLYALNSLSLKNTWLSIGSFDGVHRGHQEIVRRLSSGAHAEGAQAVVLTFHPHPKKVLGKSKDFYYLTSPEERAAILGEIGVDIVITFPFDLQVARTSARDFVENIHAHLAFTRMWVGPDFALGRKREGDVPTLRRFGSEFGFVVETIEPVTVDGNPVSSSHIRVLLGEGDVQQVRELLNRPYWVSGTVVPGDGRGRTIGIPTANLRVWEEKQLPGSGVYVCQALVNKRYHGAVTNIGVRPTFDHRTMALQVEAHILDFNKDLYDKEIRLEFLHRLREERRFSGPQALVAQIHKDIERARLMLAEKSS